jgi:DNA polymerase
LKPVFLDFETYWDKKHKIGTLTPIPYVLHPETEILSCAYQIGCGPVEVVVGEAEVIRALQGIDWSDKFAVGHNLSEFDAMLLKWRCGCEPRMWGCTLAMAREQVAGRTRLSLGALSERFALGVKECGVLQSTAGKHLANLSEEEAALLREYNANDVRLCARLFYALLPAVSRDELRIIDQTIRMLVNPAFELDIPLLRAAMKRAAEEQRALMDTLSERLGGADVKTILSSAPQTAELLRSLGVEVPRKISPSTGEPIPALAKTDRAFLALLESGDPLVAMVAQTRLEAKSTLLETRLSRFITVGEMTGGKMPVPINYYGAITGRDSGAMKLNLQNLPRIGAVPAASDALRKSLAAPKGKRVVVADLSGIEMRINMFLWRVPYAMERISANPGGVDLYKDLASRVFEVPVDTVSKAQRQAAKAMMLGCGFGLKSKTKYVQIARNMAQLTVSESEAEQHIRFFSERHPEVVEGWGRCHSALGYVHRGSPAQIDSWGMCSTEHGAIRTPVGRVRYPDLRAETNRYGRPEWIYGSQPPQRIYGGKVVENLVQHLARGVLMGCMLQIRESLGLSAAMRVHDELVYVVEEEKAEQVLKDVLVIMRTPPLWWPELKIWSEGGIGETYGDAK